MDFLKGLFANVNHKSEAGELDKKDWFSVLRVAVFVGLASAVTALISSVGSLDLGQYTPIIIPILTSVLVAVQKWIASNSRG